jgi:hypothetical protein
VGTSQSIISIVPRLPPTVDGVGDYAFNLARQLHLDYGLDTHFLIGDPDWVGNEALEGFQITKIVDRSAASVCLQLAQINSVKPILLHYVGYGYAKRGCPSWLIDGLRAWKHQDQKANLVTIFHEISASGPIWTSAFWLSALQKDLVKHLVRASDRILTSKRSYAELLQSYTSERFTTIPTLPVFSTVGELRNPSTLSERAHRLVIFGGHSKRTKVYKNFSEQLHQICRYLDIQQILDIGPPLDSIPTSIAKVPIAATGCLTSEEISAILSESIAGFFSYNPAFLGKSTIFAAYCAHGVVPISAMVADDPEEGLQPGQHYALPDQYNTEKKDMALMQAIADNAYNWYQTHSLSAQAKTYYMLLSDLELAQP